MQISYERVSTGFAIFREIYRYKQNIIQIYIADTSRIYDSNRLAFALILHKQQPLFRLVHIHQYY